MTASMLETRSKGMGGWPRKVYDRADIKFHDNSVMKLRVSFQRRSFYLLSFFSLELFRVSIQCCCRCVSRTPPLG